MSDSHELGVYVAIGLLILCATAAWLVRAVRHAPVDEPAPPGTVDLSAMAAAVRAARRPDPSQTLWRGQPGPYADWCPVWVVAEGLGGATGHEPANPIYTSCGTRMCDDLGYQVGSVMPAGAAYERQRANWCPDCYPAARVSDGQTPVWVQPGRPR